MIPSYVGIPQPLPFTFTSVDDDTISSVERLIPFDLAVYGLTMTCSTLPNAAAYHAKIQFQNYHTGELLFDEPLYNLNFQTPATTYFRLPSKWYLRKNEKVICTLESFDNVASITYYVTMLAYVVTADPNPGVQPFVYSYPINVGFQDNVTGYESLDFSQGPTGTLTKHMLYDFELHAIVLDPWGWQESFVDPMGTVPSMSFQISTPQRKLYDRMILDGLSGGGAVSAQSETVTQLGLPLRGFPSTAVQQYWLPKPVFVCKRDLIRVDISGAPTYLNTDPIHFELNQRCCMALIGNHLG